MDDAEVAFLKGMGISKKQYGDLPDFMVKGEPPNKIRIAFRNKIEPAVNLGDFTMITVSPENFVKMGKMFPAMWADMTKKK